MAAITTTAIGVASSAYQIAEGAKQKKEAKNALENFERQDLNNSYKDVQISTTGSDIIRDENAKTTASLVEASRGGGIRGILGGIPKIQEYSTSQNEKARDYMDNQIQRRDYAIAGDESAIRNMQENRDTNELAGIGQELEVGNQNMWSGIRGAGNSLIYGSNNINFKGEPKTKPYEIDQVGAKSMGLSDTFDVNKELEKMSNSAKL